MSWSTSIVLQGQVVNAEYVVRDPFDFLEMGVTGARAVYEKETDETTVFVSGHMEGLDALEANGLVAAALGSAYVKLRRCGETVKIIRGPGFNLVGTERGAIIAI